MFNLPVNVSDMAIEQLEKVGDSSGLLQDAKLQLLKHMQKRRKTSCSPADVVALAKKHAGTPLHDYIFDRSPEEAAEAYYLTKARFVLRVKVTIQIEKGVVRQLPVYVSVPSLRARGSSGRYESINTALSDPKKTVSLLDDARTQLKSWAFRFAVFQNDPDLVPLFAAINRFIDPDGKERI